ASNPVVQDVKNTTAGFGHGVMQVVDTGAQGIGYLTNHVTKFLADRGIGSRTDVQEAQDRSAALDKKITEENKAYEKKYGDSYLAKGGEIGGNLLATAPLLATGEGAVAAGPNALTRASPTVARLAATYGPNALVRLGIAAPAAGALSGAELGAATSSKSDE